MKYIAALFVTIGSALLLLSLSALWQPYDADWVTVMVGVILILIGAILKAGLNLHDHD